MKDEFRLGTRRVAINAVPHRFDDIVRADYDAALTAADEAFAAIGAVGVFEYGHRSIIGLSDLDLAVVFPDDVDAQRGAWAPKILRSFDRRIVQHAPVFLSRSVLDEWASLYPFASDVDRLHVDVHREPVRSLLFAVETVVDGVRRLQRTYERGRTTAAACMADLNSLSYSLRAVRELTAQHPPGLDPNEWLRDLAVLRGELAEMRSWTQDALGRLGVLAQEAEPLLRDTVRIVGTHVLRLEPFLSGSAGATSAAVKMLPRDEPSRALVLALVGAMAPESTLGRTFARVDEARASHTAWLHANGLPVIAVGARVLDRSRRSQVIGVMRRWWLAARRVEPWLYAYGSRPPA